MSRYATASDFFAGPLYDEYTRFPFFAQRADWIVNRWPGIIGQKAIIAGCGPGAYLVEELVARGVNCFGIDAYQRNANHGFVTLAPAPAIAARCILDADTTNNSDVSRITSRNYADLRGQQKFYLSVSEDMLPCLTSQEASAAVNIMGARSDRVLHILTCNRDPNQPDPERNTSIGLNWLTQSAWRTLINAAGGSTHICLDAETWQEF